LKDAEWVASKDSLCRAQDFGEHGRELVTVEVALRFLELLSDPSKVEAMALARGGNPEKIAALLERCVFKVLSPRLQPHRNFPILQEN